MFDIHPYGINSFSQGDINIYLSGGLYNSDPNASLGGSPSSHGLTTFVDNLFAKTSKVDYTEGAQSYRCIYVTNSGQTTYSNLVAWVSQDNNLSSVQIGVHREIEVQGVLLGGYPVGGNFSLRYNATVGGLTVSQDTQPIQFVPDTVTLANNVASALNALTLLEDVTVVANPFPSYWQCLVKFGGSHSYRYHLPLEVANNSLIGTEPTVTIYMQVQGGPVNEMASDIGFENQAPAGVIFYDATDFSHAISTGSLESLDTMAIWLSRMTPANLQPTEQTVDNADLHLEGQIQ